MNMSIYLLLLVLSEREVFKRFLKVYQIRHLLVGRSDLIFVVSYMSNAHFYD